MEAGIKLLERSEDALKAFRWANLATRFRCAVANPTWLEPVASGTHSGNPRIDYLENDYTWRPFQLAFQLLTLALTRKRGEEDRDVVDLLWFPTGGGKTEAYLALAAFQIFLRRLRHKERGGGTTVITRYTFGY